MRWQPNHFGAGLLATLLLCSFASGAPAVGPDSDLPQIAPREVPLLPLPKEGRRVHVSVAEELAAAVDNAQDGDVILLADGVYRVGRFLNLGNLKNVTLRGASNDPAKVILRGRGFDDVSRGDDILRIAGCENITVAYVTFADC